MTGEFYQRIALGSLKLAVQLELSVAVFRQRIVSSYIGPNMRVLLVEDDTDLSKRIAASLRAESLSLISLITAKMRSMRV